MAELMAFTLASFRALSSPRLVASAWRNWLMVSSALWLCDYWR